MDKKLKNIKILQNRTKLDLQQCEKALDNSEYDINQSIIYLRKENLIPAISTNDILGKCKELAIEWATDFLELTSETGELKEHYERNDLDTIQDNYLEMYVFGMQDHCPHLIFKEEFKFLTYHEVEDIISETVGFYDNAVENLLADYIK